MKLQIFAMALLAAPVQAQGVQAQGVQAQGVQTQGVQTQGVQAQGVQTQGVQTQGVQAQGVQTQGVQTQGAQARSHNPIQPLPELVLSQDDTLVTESCQIVIPEGKIIADANGDGVLQIRGKGITVRFAKGSVLRGAAPGTAWDRLVGIGIRAVDSPDLVLSGLRVHGFKVGIQLEACNKAVVEDVDASDNFRQRLGSTPAREDARDWLSPHDNDDHEWRNRYGAALYIERCIGPIVRRVRVRRGQNGIILDRVTGARIYDNDCSFLSGWGLALWRSSKNTITRNAFDFCVRGYSHGVYNRGQDSAGILMFEQCQGNFIAENSATHGGDGFFGNSGKEALGQKNKKKPSWFWSYKRRGNRGNTYLRNDFSYAAAHGFEQTFAFGERIEKNRIVGNAICGIWGGYSQGMWIHDNLIEANGEEGYGLERGGINIEHGKNLQITNNKFVQNRCAIHLWVDEDEGLKKIPWVAANPEKGSKTWIMFNHFERDDLGLHLRGKVEGIRFDEEKMVEVKEKTRFEGGAQLTDFDFFNIAFDVPTGKVLGESRPVGARKALRGRENIFMDEWGPWDHDTAFLRRLGRTAKGLAWELHGVSAPPTIEMPEEGMPRALSVWQIPLRAQLPAEGKKRSYKLLLMSDRPGFHNYNLVWKGKGYSFRLAGSFLQTEWKVRVFAWKTDPRKDYEAWKKEAAANGLEATLSDLRLRYGMGGPRDLGLSKQISKKGPGKDRFGTMARTKVRLPAGTWLIRTLSDDGIRVRAGGKVLIEDWTWHAPKKHEAKLLLTEAREVEILVEHFELDGYAVLKLDIVKAQ